MERQVATGVACMEFSVSDFFTKLFHQPCLPPFSFSFELDATPESLSTMFGEILLSASQILYGKMPHELDADEMLKMRQYYQSFGYDIEYNVKECTKEVVDYTEDGTPVVRQIKYPDYQILFKTADRSLMPGPERMF